MKPVFRFRYRASLLIILALLMVAAGVSAILQPKIQNYLLGPGGESSGGGYTLTGAFGQHDAGGSLSGGGYALSGGLFGSRGPFNVYLPLVLR